MAFGPVSVVVGMRPLDNDVDDAELGRQAPCFGFRQIHQRCVDADVGFECQAERRLHGVDEDATAIGVAGIVGLAHAADQVGDPATMCVAGGHGEKECVPGRNERRGQ